jgi:glycosyltransferase involved in cell wall biosynthesis
VPSQVAVKETVPQRIVHVSFGLDMGGLERLLLEIAEHTDPRVQQLFFISLGSIGTVGLQLRQMGWPVVCLHRPNGVRPSLILSLARIFHGIHPAVVHTHDARALIYAAPAARMMGIRRIIHTQHGQNLGMTPRRLKLIRYAAKLAQNYVCVSQDARDVAAAQGIPQDRLHVIYNGIAVDRFKASCKAHSERLTGNKKKSLVAIARLSPEKGISNLLKAVALIHRELPDLQLEVAGEGPCHADLLREANQLGIYEKVQFLGQVSDPAKVLGCGRVFALPSNSEGVSLTLLEAMAAGVPVVATSVGGTPEVLENDKTGLMVPPQNPEELANAIKQLWHDNELRDRLSLAAAQRVSEQFDINRMAQEYNQLYQGIKKLEPQLAERNETFIHKQPLTVGKQE